MLTEEDASLWRKFRAGKTASELASRLYSNRSEVGVGTVLKIVLHVEMEMTTGLFQKCVGYDADGCAIVEKIPNADLLAAQILSLIHQNRFQDAEIVLSGIPIEEIT